MVVQAQSWLLLILSLFLIRVIPTITESTYFYNVCPNNTVPITSKYQANINTVFRSLSSYATTSSNRSFGFYATGTGNGTSDAVYGLYLCRGDQTESSCRDCVSTATTTDLPKKYCPNRREAVIWYDECMVRYSHNPLLHKMNTDPGVIGKNTRVIDGNQTRFTELTGDIMNDVLGRAAQGDRLGRKFATEKTNYTSWEKVYTLAQCTPDLSDNDCETCLGTAIGQISNLNAQGARLLQPSCNIRYEIYPFFTGADNAIQFQPPVPPSPPTTGNHTITGSTTGKNKVSAKVIIAIVVPIVALCFALVLAIAFYLIRKKDKKNDAVAIQNVGEDFTKDEFLQYDLATIQSATNYFSDENKLGQGGFGAVYKGVLSDGQQIAVKRLSTSSSQGAPEFKNEVLLVAKLQHRNLVRLLGFCLAGLEKLLVYEYVPNKSLDHFLFDPEKQEILDWGRRYKIILGIARGMLYLHQDSRLKIIHRDLKASNILLDMDLNPKISDFGMARIIGVDQTHDDTSRVVGTYGYMSPEYALRGQFSVKSDVYSFGVLVLEILSGKRTNTFYISGYAEDLLTYAWKQWKDGVPMEFVDPTIRDSCSSNEVMRCIHLGLLCTQESVDDRPTMATVVLMLESQSTTLPIPEKPVFFAKSRTESIPIKDDGSDQSTNKSNPMSVNDVSVSEMEPR